MAACATTRRVAVHFCRRHIGRPVSTSERDIPEKIPTRAAQVGEGPGCRAYQYGSSVAWEAQQAHPREQIGVTWWGVQHMWTWTATSRPGARKNYPVSAFRWLIGQN